MNLFFQNNNVQVKPRNKVLFTVWLALVIIVTLVMLIERYGK